MEHTHTVSLFSLSLTAGPDLPLWPGWWQRLWHWPLSWALLPQRRARALLCARACWSWRGESEPVNMTGVPSLTHWLVWHAHVHINVIQTCVLALSLSPPNPASTPFPLIQIKSFQTQISIIHLIQIMPCDKNYPYCNNPLNWERAAHQKEKGEKGLEVRVVAVGETCQPVSNQDPHNKNFFPFWGGSLEAHWDDEIEVNWKKAWENAPTINNPRIKLALAWRDDGGRMKSEWRWMTLRHVGWTIQHSSNLDAVSIQGQRVYLWCIPYHLAIRQSRLSLSSLVPSMPYEHFPSHAIEKQQIFKCCLLCMLSHVLVDNLRGLACMAGYLKPQFFNFFLSHVSWLLSRINEYFELYNCNVAVKQYL